MHAPIRPLLFGLAITASLLLAALLVFAQELGVLVAGAGILFLFGLLLHRQMSGSYLRVLALLLLGYMFLNRGAAYFGVGPVYVGEIVLFAGLLIMAISMVKRASTFGLMQSGLVWLYILLALFGVARTLPYIDEYGLDALRDAALWYYGAFTLLAVWLFDSRKRFELSLRWFSWALPLFMIWVPIAYLITLNFPEALPTVPGTDQAILTFRASDAAVFVGAGIAFLLLFGNKGSRFLRAIPPAVLWSLAAVAFLFVATGSRGGLLAIFAGLLVVLGARPSLRTVKRSAVGLAVLLLVGFIGINASLDIAEREVSTSQLQDNISSLYSTATGQGIGNDNLGGTIDYRLAYWSEVVEEMFTTSYFWAGHGFGLNLANYYGFQVTDDDSLRNTHNSYLTMLARMGVPAFAIWVLFNAAYIFSMLRGILVARRRGSTFWESVNIWLVSFWAIATMNAIFSPYFDGPQGGIWFWTTVGMGIAALRVQNREARDVAVQTTIPARRRTPVGSA